MYRRTHATVLRLVAEGLVDGSGSTTSTGWPTRPPTCAGWPPRCRSWWWRRSWRTARACPDWPVAGTTGYEFLAVADGVLVDQAAAGAFAAGYRDLTGADPDPAAVALACKRERLERDFGLEVAGVARHLPGDQAANRAAVVELAAQLPVYRTYVTDGGPAAAPTGRPRRGGPPGPGRGRGGGARPAGRAPLLEAPAPEAVRRFQQLTGPAMAKGSRTPPCTATPGWSPATRSAATWAASAAWWPSCTRPTPSARPTGPAACSPPPPTTPSGARTCAPVWPSSASASTTGGRWPPLDRPPRRRRRPGRRPPAVADHGRGLAAGAGARCLAYMEKAAARPAYTTWTDPDPAYERAVAALVERAYGDRSWPSWRSWSPSPPCRPGQGRRPGPPPPHQPRRPRHLPGHRDRAAGPGRPRQPPPRPLHRRRLPQVPRHPNRPAPAPRPPRAVHRLPTPRRPRPPGRLHPRRRPPGRGRHPPHHRPLKPRRSAALPTGPWRDLLSATTTPAAPPPADQPLATLPHAPLVRA